MIKKLKEIIKYRQLIFTLVSRELKARYRGTALGFVWSFANPLLRLIVGPIDVFYHQEHRFLMRYEGMSNISDPNGENHKVRIDFPLGERSDWNAGPRPAASEVRHAS